MPPSSGCGDERRRSRVRTAARKNDADRFVVPGVARAGRAARARAAAGARRQQVVVQQRRQRRAEFRAATARAADAAVVAAARRPCAAVVVEMQPRAEAELLAELQRRRLLREHRVGPGLDGEAVDLLGADQAAERGRASSSVNGMPRCASSYAAARPVMPPPMMTITSRRWPQCRLRSTRDRVLLPWCRARDARCDVTCARAPARARAACRGSTP